MVNLEWEIFSRMQCLWFSIQEKHGCIEIKTVLGFNYCFNTILSEFPLLLIHSLLFIEDCLWIPSVGIISFPQCASFNKWNKSLSPVTASANLQRYITSARPFYMAVKMSKLSTPIGACKSCVGMHQIKEKLASVCGWDRNSRQI